MSALFQSLLSRRTFMKSGAVLSALFLAACTEEATDDDTQADPTPTEPAAPEPTAAPDPTATPEPTATPQPTPTPTPEPLAPVSYALADGLSEEQHSLVANAIDALREVADQHGLELVRADGVGSAAVHFFHPGDAPEESKQIHGEPLIAVVRTDHLIDRVLQDDVTALFNREIENWQQLGGNDWIVHPTISQQIIPPEFGAESHVHPHGDLVALSREHPGMLALIPRSAATFHLQTLIVDDIDPVREELSADNWPWWEWIDFTVDHPDSDLGAQVTEALRGASSNQVAPRRMMVTVVGDVMLGRTPHRIMFEQNDWRAPFPLVADELQRGDLTIGNLECAITDSFSPPTDPTTFSFMTFTDAVEGLQFAGFDALSGANNHALDFGVVGMQDTTEALRAGGIQHFGTGNNLQEAREPCLLDYNGATFAFLGYDAISMNYAGATPESGGVAPLLEEYFVEDIQRAREVADVVIPYFHWGVEYTLIPTDNDRRLARVAVDAGADLVLGGHPHWVQGMEIYDGTAIFYSTANFVFDQEWSFETKQGFVLHLVFDGASLVSYRVVPVLIEDFHRPRIVEDDVRSTILGRFWASSDIIAHTPLP